VGYTAATNPEGARADADVLKMLDDAGVIYQPHPASLTRAVVQSNPDVLTLAPFGAGTDDSGELWANDTDGETRARTEPDSAGQCLGAGVRSGALTP